MLPEISENGQQRILESSVLIVGCGALGTIVAMYLAGSGVGRIGIADFDTVDISNLQRQLSYGVDDIGRKKTDVLVEKIKSVNPAIKVEIFDTFLTAKNIYDIIQGFDIVVEGSDNPDTKYLVSEACVSLELPCVIGGISGTSGQIMTYVPGHASYKDIFPEGVEAGGFTPCALGGVLGPLPGIVGSIQAVEAIKLIVPFGKPLIDRLLLVDSSSLTFTTIRI